MASRRHPIKVVKPRWRGRTFALDEVFPDCRRHPFVRALAGRYGFRGPGAEAILERIAEHLRLEFTDYPFAEPEYDGETVIFSLEDFTRLTEEELGFEFIHELSHELQRRSGIDVFAEAHREWREQSTEQRALRDSVLYLRYLGMGDREVETFLRSRYDGLLTPGDVEGIVHDTRET